MYIKYLSENKTMLKYYINIDIHPDLMPSALMNWGMKNICGKVFEFIKQSAENLPETYEKKKLEKPEFYAYLQDKIDTAIGKK